MIGLEPCALKFAGERRHLIRELDRQGVKGCLESAGIVQYICWCVVGRALAHCLHDLKPGVGVNEDELVLPDVGIAYERFIPMVFGIC